MSSLRKPELNIGCTVTFNYKGTIKTATVTKVKRTYVLAKLTSGQPINLSMKLITQVDNQPFDFFSSTYSKNQRTWKADSELTELFHELNQRYFNSALKPIKISSSSNMRRASGKFGIRKSGPNFIRMTRGLPNNVQERVLLHEMVHYYIYSALKKPHERHGALFNEISNKIGIGQARLKLQQPVKYYHRPWQAWTTGIVIRKHPYRVKIKVRMQKYNTFTEFSVSPDSIFTLDEFDS